MGGKLERTTRPMEGRLRLIQPARDLSAIADLIELCFYHSLDTDGQNYLKQMRDTARIVALVGDTAPFLDQSSSMPRSGFVWDVGGRIVGNVTMIPFQSQGTQCSLIANVAVHPDFRDQGIGRALTEAALRSLRNDHYQAAWLQVRDDNPVATHLYQQLDFKEYTRRTTWLIPSAGLKNAVINNLVCTARQPAFWSQQQLWLQQLYPEELSWQLNIQWKAFQPGLAGSIQRILNLNFPRHWAVIRHGKLAAMLSWVKAANQMDSLLLAAPLQWDGLSIQALIVHVRRQIPTRRQVQLNTPFGFASDALLAAGCVPQQTLIWMRCTLNSAG
jgi:ribosomal protein S18 acetylase RimI-like enzyme